MSARDGLGLSGAGDTAGSLASLLRRTRRAPRYASSLETERTACTQKVVRSGTRGSFRTAAGRAQGALPHMQQSTTNGLVIHADS